MALESQIFVEYHVKGCEKLLFNHTLFIKHYLACMKAGNLDRSSHLYFDVPQKCCICGDSFSNLLAFSNHVNLCMPQLSNTCGLMAPSVVPKDILTKKQPNQWFRLPLNFFSVPHLEQKERKKIKSNFCKLWNYFLPGEHVFSKLLIVPQFFFLIILMIEKKKKKYQTMGVGWSLNKRKRYTDLCTFANDFWMCCILISRQMK